jgi:Ca2+-binding EF-hand superfamily protein
MATLSGNDPAAGEARFRKFDANGDGRVTKEEFLADGAKGK